MSVKKKFQDMQAYLSKDEAGQKMLKALKDDVNALRKKAATLQVVADEAAALASRTIEHLKESDAALKLAQQKVQQLQAKVNSSAHRVSALESDLDKERGASRMPLASGDMMKDLTAKSIGLWSEKTIKELGSLPEPSMCVVRHPAGYHLTDVLTAFNDRGFATIGRIVALRVLLQNSVCFFLPSSIDSEDVIDKLKDEVEWDSATRHYLTLFSRSTDPISDAELLKIRTSGKLQKDNNLDAGDTTSAVVGKRAWET